MEQGIENLVIYTLTALLCVFVVWLYIRKIRRDSRVVEEKIRKARQEGLYEPVSLHPVVDVNTCIGTGACVAACPEKDILGIRNGKATTINASICVGHGACFHACPTQAITLCIGTEKRGVDLPHVNEHFETNVPGIYIAGELGGMGLIRNAVEQGRQAVENMVKDGPGNHKAGYDLVIVGAGPAGISASLAARRHNLRFLTLEQDTLGGTVFTYPRSKIVMTSAMNLPLYGKVKLAETTKAELLELWQTVLGKFDIAIRENTRVASVVAENGHFRIESPGSQAITSRFVLLAIGRRGTPRRLGIPGEDSEKVAYRLLEPEMISGKQIMVVGGGDSAIESALLLAVRNRVILSYRGEAFSRLKPANLDRIREAAKLGQVELKLSTNLVSIGTGEVILASGDSPEPVRVENDLVYVFAGGELPADFLVRAGIRITRKFGEAILKHNDRQVP